MLLLLILRNEESRIPKEFLSKDAGSKPDPNKPPAEQMRDALGLGLTPKRIREIKDKHPNPPWDATGQYWNDGAHTFPSYDLPEDLIKIKDEVDKNGGLQPQNIPGTLSANLTTDNILDRLKFVKEQWDEAKKKMDKLCPSPPEDPPFDELEEQRRFNQLIARCIADCYKQAVADCKTVHCYCGSYKCEGPTIKPNPLGPGPKKKNKFPTEEVFSDEVSDANLSITYSSYDLPIELVYTRHFFAGNILWMSETREERSTTTTKTFEKVQDGTVLSGKWVITHKLHIDTYIDFQIGICAGEIEGVSRIWMDNNLVYDVSAGANLTIGDSQGRMTIEIGLGSESQRVNGTQAELVGLGLVPAYRGIVNITFKDMNINQLRQFPQFKVEVYKRITADKPQLVSAVIADADVGQYWRVDTASQRIFIGTTAGLRVLDYNTFATVKDVALDDPVVAVTPLPYVLTAVGDDISMFDVTYAEQRGTPYTAEAPFDHLFPYRAVDFQNTGWDMLVGSNAAGDVGFYTTYDTDPFQDTLMPNSWSRAGLGSYVLIPACLSDVAEAYCFQEISHTDGYESSALRVTDMFFAFRGEGGTVEIAQFIHNSTDPFLEDFALDFEEFENLEIVVQGATTVVVLGAMPCERDQTIILFLDVDSGFQVLKWHPEDGVLWTTTATSLPNWGVQHLMFPGFNRFFHFIGADNLVYRLDTDTGFIVAVSSGTYPDLGADQRQFYEPNSGSILYFSDDDTLVRLYVGRIQIEVETLTDVIKDVSKRAGLDGNLLFLDGITDVNITGYRSGGALIARTVLEPLFQVYPVASYIDLGLRIISKGAADNIVVDADDLGTPFKSKRLSEAFDIKSASIEYYSDNADGERATQMFSLPDDVFSGKNEIRESYNVLETDDYMMALAELRVYTVQENDAEAEITLPVKYIALTPSDELTINGEWRAPRVDIGADLSIKVVMSRDTADKYEELLELSGILGFGRFIQNIVATPLVFPLVHTNRCVLPSASYSMCTYFGASNLLDEHNLPIRMGESRDEKGFAVGRTPVKFTYPVAWGTLITPPVNDSRAFSLYRDQTMVVRFDDPEYVERLIDFGFVPSMYMDALENMLIVGDEHIRFLQHEVDMDGVTVTFRHLARARDCTDSMMVHTAGETVIVYDNFIMDHVEATSGELGAFTHKIGASNSSGYIRRSDVGENINALRPIAVSGIVRYDEGPVSPGYAGAKDIIVRYIPRKQNIDAFYESKVHELGLGAVRDATVYFLDDTYDEATFDADLLSPSGYILHSGIHDIDLPDGTRGLRWRADDQQDDLFNNTLRTVNVVIISQASLSGLTRRIIATWTPGDYTRRPTRGIVTNVYN